MISLDLQFKRDDFQLQLKSQLQGAVTGVLGPSGAGKTTLLHLIAGLQRRNVSGRIQVGDETLLDTQSGIYVPPHRRRIGVVFQENRLFPHMSVAGNLHYGTSSRPSSENGGTSVGFDEVVGWLHLESLLSRRVFQISGGEARRVALGRALLSSPRLLLLDEPLSGLHASLRREIISALRRFQERTDIPILVVSHQIQELFYLTEDLLVLSEGRCVGQGHYLELLENPEVVEMVRSPGLVNVLPLEVVSLDEKSGVSQCRPVGTKDSADGAEGSAVAEIKAPWDSHLSVGKTVHVAIRPGAISLAKQHVSGISIQNQLKGRITRLFHAPQASFCLVDVQGISLLVEISHGSEHALDLQIGTEIFCLFKSQDVRFV